MGLIVKIVSKDTRKQNAVPPAAVLKATPGAVFREIPSAKRTEYKPSYFINLGWSEPAVLVLYWSPDAQLYYTSAQTAAELKQYVPDFMVEDVTDTVDVEVAIHVHDKNA